MLGATVLLHNHRDASAAFSTHWTSTFLTKKTNTKRQLSVSKNNLQQCYSQFSGKASQKKRFSWPGQHQTIWASLTPFETSLAPIDAHITLLEAFEVSFWPLDFESEAGLAHSPGLSEWRNSFRIIEETEFWGILGSTAWDDLPNMIVIFYWM